MKRHLAPAVVVVAVTAFGLWPLGLLLVRAFGLSWSDVWSQADGWAALRGTLVTSLGAAIFSFAIGVPLSIVIERTDVRFKPFFRLAFTLPSAVPPYLWTMGWIALANPKSGLLNLLFGRAVLDIYSPMGISFVLGATGLPLVMLSTSAVLQRVDAALEESALMSGASLFKTLRDVSLPLALPAALSGALLVFSFSAASFGVPYMLGVVSKPPVPTLATRIYGELLMGNDGLSRAAVLSSVLFSLPGLSIAGGILLRRLSTPLMVGKGFRRAPLPLAKHRNWVSGALLVGTLVLIALPLAAIVGTSLQKIPGQWLPWSASHWAAVLTDPRTLQAARNSLILALVAAALVTTLGLFSSLSRRSWVAALTEVPYAIPGSVLAVALLVAFTREIHFIAFDTVTFVLALSNSLWLMLVAYVVKHLALGARGASDAMKRIDPSLVEASRISGANPLKAFLHAVIPQIRTALTVAFTLAFLSCLTELTLSVLLVPTGNDVLGTLLFEMQTYADPSSAAVLASTVLLVVVGALVTIQLRQEGAAHVQR